MSLQLFTDSSSNLFEQRLDERNIKAVSLTLSMNEDEILCYEPGVTFDSDAFFQRMREDDSLVLKTSMINTATFLNAFEPVLAAGDDVLYIAMSSGLSGTFSGGTAAANILKEKYPQRYVHAVDTRSATIGQGMLVLEAADLRDAGRSPEEIAAHIEWRRTEIHQHFMVDDLNFLKRGGRLSGSAAMAGSIMHLKPILKGDEEGRIVLDKKLFGRKKALSTLVDIFLENHTEGEDNRKVGISHTGSEEDAKQLASELRKFDPGLEIEIVPFEPCTASHVGPGAVGMFFF